MHATGWDESVKTCIFGMRGPPPPAPAPPPSMDPDSPYGEGPGAEIVGGAAGTGTFCWIDMSTLVANWRSSGVSECMLSFVALCGWSFSWLVGAVRVGVVPAVGLLVVCRRVEKIRKSTRARITMSLSTGGY
mmetsp:Transcript_12488/g.25939  ORF Transcript_12488/g.25939 Transcript_12488/m.25939 type:complete len:132 (+) Transcript_12488:886-1281(+)